MVLVELQRGDDRVAIVVESDGRRWLAHGHGAPPRPITLLEGLESAISGPDWAAFGGALPHTAQTAETKHVDGTWQPATTANDAWIAFSDGRRQCAFATPAVSSSRAPGSAPAGGCGFEATVEFGPEHLAFPADATVLDTYDTDHVARRPGRIAPLTAGPLRPEPVRTTRAVSSTPTRAPAPAAAARDKAIAEGDLLGVIVAADYCDRASSASPDARRSSRPTGRSGRRFPTWPPL